MAAASQRTRLGVRVRSIALADQLGPGLITGAADDDPSGIATYSQAGAQFGYGLIWTMLLTYPLMSAVQLISAQIGRVTGCGLAKNLQSALPAPIVTILVVLLFVANTINIGADLAAMADAAELVIGGGSHVFLIAFAFVSLGLQLFIPYRRYANILKWLTLTLLAYVAVLLVVKVDWSSAGLGAVWPRLYGKSAVVTIVAVFGTTISPYLFFWQSAQEAEEVASDSASKPLKKAPSQAPRQFLRMRIDTFTGMAVSNLIAIAIMLATAATLNAKGVHNIETAAQAANALRPIAGPLAFLLFAFGIIGTGMLAVPVLAGSAAYAIGESRGWKCGLEHPPWEAVGFYAIIVVSMAIGIAIDWSPINPIKALFWSAVINGVVAVPIMVAMMVVVTHERTMGRFTGKGPLLVFGWIATGVMGVAAVAMFATWQS